VRLLERLADIEQQHAIWAETGARWKSYLGSGC
jgi:hypothetical protein